MKKGWLSCACMCAIRVYTCVFLICAKVVTGLGHQASRPQGPFCAGIINAGHHTSFLTGSWRSNSAPHAAWQALCWRSHLPRPFLIFFFFISWKATWSRALVLGWRESETVSDRQHDTNGHSTFLSCLLDMMMLQTSPQKEFSNMRQVRIDHKPG